MTKNNAAKKSDQPEAQTVFVPALGYSIEAVDQADIERQVKEALAAKDGDANS